MAKKGGIALANQTVKLIVGAGQASPSPPVGPALGSRGVKAIDFCKEFNATTQHILTGTPVPVVITIRPDRSFTFALRTPPTAQLLLTAAGAAMGKKGKPKGANAPARPAAPQASQAADEDGEGAEAGSLAAARALVGAGVTKMINPMAPGATKPAGSGGGTVEVGTVSLKHVWEIAKIKQTDPRLSELTMEGLVKSVIAQARAMGVAVVP